MKFSHEHILLSSLAGLAVGLTACGSPSPVGFGDGNAGGDGATSETTATTTSTGGGGGAGAGGSGQGGTAPGVEVLPLGTVQSLGSTACDPDPNLPQLKCEKLKVTCPGLAPLDVTLGIDAPQGSIKGTVVAHDGGPGMTFFYRSDLLKAYKNAGFRIVEMKWASDWELNAQAPSVLAAACRPATVFEWIHQNKHPEGTSAAFCGQGHSAGSAALAYSLAHYGLKNRFDFELFSAGPPVSRIECGCDTDQCGFSTIALCPALPDAPIDYPQFAIDNINKWEVTSSCGKQNPPQADVAKWAAASILAPGADYDYPQTVISPWYCANNTANVTTGQGAMFIQKVVGNPTPVCVTQGCQQEDVYAGTMPGSNQSVINGMLAAMNQQCVPRH